MPRPYVPSIKPPPPPEYDGVISGSPEGVVTGTVGMMVLDGDTDTLYYKKTGDFTNTGWVAVTGAGGNSFPDGIELGDGSGGEIEFDDAAAGVWIGTLTGDVETVVHEPVNPAWTTLTDGATVTWTLSATKLKHKATLTLGGNRALAFSGLVAGMGGVLVVKQPGSGGPWGLTLPASSLVINDGSGVVDLTDDASAIDVLAWEYDGTNIFWTFGANFS